ncbi:MAG: hypothetical protein H0W69_02395 [Gemmatimonadaceae bacterium]|nr:hypothetical protein [Gemmatimonadaceae bacterium]
MAEAASHRLTAGEGRRFALTLAAAFALIGLITGWRGRETFSRATLLISSILLIAAITVPRRLGPVERAWTRFGEALSRITSPIFLGVVYFAVFASVGALRKMLGRNSIAHRAVENSYWKTREPIDADSRRLRMERQF